MSLVNTMIRAGAQLQAFSIAVACEAATRNEQWDAELRAGRYVLIRQIRKQDIALERRFIACLSPQSRRFRFLGTLGSPSDALLRQLVDIDPACDVALIALIVEGTQEREIGVARLSAGPDRRSCKFAVTVSDEWQRKGLGTLLMHRLIDSAVTRGLESMHAISAVGNDGMREFAGHLGFHRESDPNDRTQMLYSLDLKSDIHA